VEEIIRYVSPVIWMRRSLTRDTVMNGHQYREGDKVALIYQAANRDESVFADPDSFDISRSPNPHVGFGSAGPHFCLGAHLARREITAMLRELLHRVPGIRAAGGGPVGELAGGGEGRDVSSRLRCCCRGSLCRGRRRSRFRRRAGRRAAQAGRPR
jgi:cytochrome P450